jgi:3-hydroxyisobutyrate dehydrogenase-like beta-hydroxyacid dehydrogenase
MKIGFIGTGSIGNPVAMNLLQAGHSLFIHDIQPKAYQNLEDRGAVACATPAQVACHAEMIFLSLPSNIEVNEVCFSENGLLKTIKKGCYLCDLTTVSIQLIPQLEAAEKSLGFHYLTSPVSEGVDNARQGKLSIFVGGDKENYEHCLPVYACIAKEVIYTGSHFSAIAAKLLTNLLWFIHAAAIGEALILGAKSGIDLPTLEKVILNSCGNSWVASHDIPSIYDGSYDPSFSIRLCCKDLRLINELAAQLNVPIEMGALAEQIFRRASNVYGEDAPELSVVRYLEEITETPLNSRKDANLDS